MPHSAPGEDRTPQEIFMRPMIKSTVLPKFFTALALTCAALTLGAPQCAAQMAKQYTPPNAEPVPQSSTLENAPPAPALPADWTKQLADRHESITTDRQRIHVFRFLGGPFS